MRTFRRLLVAGMAIAGLAFVGTQSLKADCAVPIGQVESFAQETITVSSTAIGFTVATYADGTGTARYASASVESNPLRFWDDGSVPTSSAGTLVQPGQQIEICGENSIRRFLAIRTGSDATLVVRYYR